jgi:hypothetical protein
MTSFDNRKKAFEDKFAHDADLKFKAEARRNKMVATWAAGKLGLSGADTEDYIKSVRKADLAEAGDDDVVRKIAADFKAKSVAVSDDEIRKMLGEYLAEAVRQIETGT